MSETIILSPHLDDAVLSAWHRVNRLGSRVVTLFAGVPVDTAPSDWDVSTGFQDAAQAVLTRRRENQVALAATPAAITDLDYLDDVYNPPPRNVPEMAEAIQSLTPPDAIYLAAGGIIRYRGRTHPDHITTRDVGKRLMDLGRTVLFYAEYPYAYPLFLYKGWPEHIPIGGLKRALQSDVAIEPYELTAEEQARKRMAAKEYRSQYPVLTRRKFGVMGRSEAFRWEIILRPS